MNTSNRRLIVAALVMMAATTGLTSTAQERKEEEKLQKAKTTFVEGTQSAGKEGSAMVADGHKWTKWCVDAPQEMPYHVTIDATKAVSLKAYALVTAEDTHTYPTRNPIAWNVYGSNDRKEWTLVDNVKYNRQLRDENEQTYLFGIKESKAWRYYRFEFTRMTEGTRLQLAEIELYE
ncbi:MAG: DUF5000 domain-containing lipoprotein [Bacteroidaceae bacterium]